MTTVRAPLLVRRVHKWLALFVGIQAVIWTASGMYMAPAHIDTIHGDHLVRPAAARPQSFAGLVSPAKVVAAHGVDLIDISSGGNHPAQKIDPHNAYQVAIAGS